MYITREKVLKVREAIENLVTFIEDDIEVAFYKDKLAGKIPLKTKQERFEQEARLLLTNILPRKLQERIQLK